MPHVWMSHVTYMNESCHKYINESCHISEWVMPHIWMNHATYMNETCHIHQCVMPHTYNATHGHAYECVMVHIWMHSNMLHGSLQCATGIHMCDMSHVWQTFVCVTCQMSDMSHVAHLNEPCNIFGWVIPHIWMSRVLVTWWSAGQHMWMKLATQLSASCHTMILACHTYEWVMSHREWGMVHRWMYHVTLMVMACHTYEWVIPHT